MLFHTDRHGSYWTSVGPQRLHARVAAPRGIDARPDTTHVVLLHGLGMSSTYMVPLLERVARTRPAWALDMPGHGSSPGGRHAVPLADQAELLEGWLAAAGIGRAVLLGHSLGGQVIGEHARRYPQRVAGLVLADPSCDQRHRAILVQALRLASTQPLEPKRLLPVKARDVLHVGLLQVVDEFRYGQDHDLREALAEVHAPVAVLRGSRDLVANRRWIRELADAAAGPAWTRELEGHAHCTNFTGAAIVAEEIERVATYE